MIRGLYTSAAGMLAGMDKTDVISNNLANINTAGFKKDRAVMRAFPQMNIHRVNDTPAKPFIGIIGTGVQLDEISIDYTQGSIKYTNNPFNLAIEGEGFFEVLTDAGLRYTRDGNFTVNTDGFLVTMNGDSVMGQNGPMVLQNSRKVSINENGEVFSDGEFVDRLVLVSFDEKNSLTKEGEGLYASNQQPSQARARVLQGALEEANVNSISEMVDLISAFRAYEANQKAVRAHDETLERAVNEIARL